MNAASAARKTAGRKFATLTFFPKSRFNPTQKMSTDPTKERFAIAESVINGPSRDASSVIDPSQRNTGIAEKAQPFPMELVMKKPWETGV